MMKIVNVSTTKNIVKTKWGGKLFSKTAKGKMLEQTLFKILNFTYEIG